MKAKYRDHIPMLENELFLTDGGLETTIIFDKGIDLPEFAAFTLLEKQQNLLKEYYQKYINIAKEQQINFILESPTWRASSKWGKILGYDDKKLEKINNQAITLLENIRKENETSNTKIVISCCLGPKGDGYTIEDKMSINESEKYHSKQIKTISNTNADLVTAFTLSYTDEAIGIVKACEKYKIPVVIGFTLETDGKLPSKESLEEAIKKVDKETENYPLYYMVNCVHPIHFNNILEKDSTWKLRIQEIRANASKKSHKELDEAYELDEGDPIELSHSYKKLVKNLDNLNIFGGCCGTNHIHVKEIVKEIIKKAS